ncbi:MAG: Nre family DNA repair protein [Candidatus Bilamarchaeaceae archaeon]
MVIGKSGYLKKLTSRMRLKTVAVGKSIEGSTPPSVFIGSWNYPKVYAGPMLAPFCGDTSILDTPESWIPNNKTIEELVNYRLNLIRGKQQVSVKDLNNRLVEKLQEISLAATSIESEAEFKYAPVGHARFDDEHTPFGPSAPIERFDIGNCRWEHLLEKAYYDTDLKAAQAIRWLYTSGVSFSKIQKAFSVGAFGIKRKLVPTRWSITACDMTLADGLLEEVKHYDIIDCYRVHEFSSLKNYYVILLIPTAWQYEWMEAFLHVLGKEELIFTDYETNRGKKEYSKVGGCYYSCKFSLLEGLAKERKQAGAIVFREAYSGYVPLGVFNVRENVRWAMAQPSREFQNLKSALSYISTKLRLPLSRYVTESILLKELLSGRQLSLCCRL